MFLGFKRGVKWYKLWDWRSEDSSEQKCHFWWVFYGEDFKVLADGERLDQEDITVGEERCIFTVSR